VRGCSVATTFLSGTVVHGREARAARSAFPTANLESLTECLPPRRRLRDARGAARRARFASINQYRDAADVRRAPRRTIEAHIFDFDRDIYGATIRLEIVERIRGRAQVSIRAQALAAQIAEDLKRAKRKSSPPPDTLVRKPWPAILMLLETVAGSRLPRRSRRPAAQSTPSAAVLHARRG